MLQLVMKTEIIYKITNNLTGYSYVGQTTRKLNTRWLQHCNPNQDSNMAISRAIRKYGKDNFSIEQVVAGVPVFLLDVFEMYWIHFYNTYKSGYNSTIGGKCVRGLTPWNKGKSNCYSADTLTKMREAKLGKTPVNLEQLRLLATERTGVNHHNTKLANVYNYSTKELIAEGVTLTSWCKEHGYNQGNVCATARGTSKKTAGIYAVYQENIVKEEPFH